MNNFPLVCVLLFLTCGLLIAATPAQYNYLPPDYYISKVNSSSTSTEPIPETNLFTNTFYILRLQRFPSGSLTWTNQVHSTGSRYVQADNRDSSYYHKTGIWYKHNQWTMQPFSGRDGGNDGWYEIVNRGIPGEYLTISNAGDDVGYGPNKHYLLLNPNYYPNFSSPAENDRFLWRPLKYTNFWDKKVYYQLQNKAFPYGMVTWTENKYQTKGYYMQLDNTEDSRYHIGGEWFDDTMLVFEPVEKTSSRTEPVANSSDYYLHPQGVRAATLNSSFYLNNVTQALH